MLIPLTFAITPKINKYNIISKLYMSVAVILLVDAPFYVYNSQFYLYVFVFVCLMLNADEAPLEYEIFISFRPTDAQ